jgi:pimeloyl-ACP methyl ester carboxylesterase
MTTNSAPTTVSTPAAGAIFVHGLFSGPEVWDPLISLLQSDTSFSRAFQFERFSYSSPKFLQLTTWLRDNDQLRGIPRIVLVGHSQGGLIIQQSMSEMLSDGQIEALRRVRAVILLATPNTGSELLLSLRRILGRIWRHAQERQLRPYDEQIEKMRRVVFERAVLPTVPSETVCPIRFFVYAGETDGVVPPRSALGFFQETIQRSLCRPTQKTCDFRRFAPLSAGLGIHSHQMVCSLKRRPWISQIAKT